MQILGYIIVAIGIFFVFVGLFGIYRFNNFYARMLSAADVDTLGLITILIGLFFIYGFEFFTLKMLLILVVLVILNPIVSSSITSSAYFSGYKLKNKKEDEND